MKLTFPAAVAVAGTLALVVADQVPTPTQVSSNVTIQGGSKSSVACKDALPYNGIGNWYYNSKAEGPYYCTSNHDDRPWAMVNAYRSGGTEGVHWKYTNDPNDSECLTNWNYFKSNGKDLIEYSIARTTFSGDTRRWCGLPVYRSGGAFENQWAYCSCSF